MSEKRTVPSTPDLLPVVKALLTGMAIHPLKGNAEDYQTYRARVQKAMDSLRALSTAEEVSRQAQEAVHALRDFGLRTAKRLHAQDGELRAIVHLLLETIKDIRIATPERTGQLMEIGDQLGSAVEPEEIRLAKSQLAECLAVIRKEAERELSHTGDQADRDRKIDLAARPAAEAALAQACAGETPMCAVVMLISRVPLYARRYGPDAGDRVLKFFVDFARNAFQQGSFYRWTGPSILMLCEGTVDKVQAEVRRVLEPRLEYDFETPSRTILLAIDASWAVLPMMVDPRLLINKIDAFVV